MLNRWFAGALTGGLATYLFDPELGARRRRHLIAVWRENESTAKEAQQMAMRAAAQMEPLAYRITGGRWPARDRGMEVGGVVPLLLGTAIGGALVYFFDPESGARRRLRARSFLQEKRDATTATVTDAISRGRHTAEEQVRNARSQVSGRI